jgi:hypothetical protein
MDRETTSRLPYELPDEKLYCLEMQEEKISCQQ